VIKFDKLACFIFRVTTCPENLENLEVSGNLKHVREMSGML